MSEAVTVFMVGTVECRVLSDGIMAYEPDLLYTGLPAEQTGPVVRPLLNDRGLVRLPYHPLLVRTAAGLALIDTGAGPGLAEQFGSRSAGCRKHLPPREWPLTTSRWSCCHTPIPIMSAA